MSWNNDYINIPFVEHGRTREGGVDCWGLICVVYLEQKGIVLPMLTDYKDTHDNEALNRIITTESSERRWVSIPKGQEQPFDVVVIRNRGIPTHVGVVVRKGSMLHCERGSGVSFVDYTERQMIRKVEGFFRYADCSNCPSAISSP